MKIKYDCLRDLAGKVQYINLETGNEVECLCPNKGVNPTEFNEFFSFKNQFVAIIHVKDCPVHGKINCPENWS